MKKLLICITLLMFVATSAFAANFAPTLMKLSAPTTIKYDFGGTNLNVPVTVTGVAGAGYFLVFTKDKGASIGEVTNGYLGWHHVNKIDTCLYVSNITALNKGTNTISWNGKGEGGANVAAGDYTYYIWAFDNVNTRIQMTKQVTISPWIFRTIITHDSKTGAALTQPIWYTGSGNRSQADTTVTHTHTKWVVGGDPEDATLKETTSSPGWCAVGGIAFEPTNPKNFFFDTLKGSTTMKVTAKYEWVPNGKSIMDSKWGDNGMISYKGDWTKGWNFGPGCVSDGKDYLFVVNADIGNNGKVSELIYLDVTDGSEIKRLDLSEWWVDVNEGTAEALGQYTGGPTEIAIRNNLMGLGSHSTCVNQLIDPYYTDEKEAVKWTNTNGDYTGDHNFEPTAKVKWVCNDYNVGPYKYSTALDANLFMIFPSFDMGAVSFGLYAPDGTGMGYQTLAGETAYQKYGAEFIDYDSAYDGIYTTSNVGRTAAGADATIWFIAHDSIKGVITNQVGVAEAPAAFAVAQNTPNPFNPTTTITFSLAKAGKTTVEVFNVAGQKVDTILNASLSAGAHSVTWNAAKHSAGVYFYTVKSGDFSKTMKMTLLK
jgi:flagellar hook assembly protein FlgD